MLTVTELARELDVTARQIARWKAAGCPYERDGTRILFELADVQAWRESGSEPPPAKRGRPKTKDVDPDAETLADVQLRKERALAAKHELFVQEKRGEFVALAVLREQVGAAFYQLRQRLNAITPRMRQRHGKAVATDVEIEIDQALESLVTEWTAAAAP